MASKKQKDITDRQQEVLDFIRQHIAEQGSSPAFRDVMRHFGFKSPNAVMCYLRVLKKKGEVDWTPGTYRTVRLTKKGIPLITLEQLSKK